MGTCPCSGGTVTHNSSPNDDEIKIDETKEKIKESNDHFNEGNKLFYQKQYKQSPYIGMITTQTQLGRMTRQT